MTDERFNNLVHALQDGAAVTSKELGDEIFRIYASLASVTKDRDELKEENDKLKEEGDERHLPSLRDHASRATRTLPE